LWREERKDESQRHLSPLRRKKNSLTVELEGGAHREIKWQKFFQPSKLLFILFFEIMKCAESQLFGCCCCWFLKVAKKQMDDPT
jgi:hypothetical protein